MHMVKYRSRRGYRGRDKVIVQYKVTFKRGDKPVEAATNIIAIRIP